MSSPSSIGTRCNISQAQVNCLFAKIKYLEIELAQQNVSIGKLQRRVIDLESSDNKRVPVCNVCGKTREAHEGQRCFVEFK